MNEKILYLFQTPSRAIQKFIQFLIIKNPHANHRENTGTRFISYSKDKGGIRKQATTDREFFFARGMNDANLVTALFNQANTNLHKKENQLGKQYILGS